MSDNKIPQEPIEPQEQKVPEVEPKTEGATPESKTLTVDEIQKLLQSEADKIRTEYSKKIKALESEKEAEKERLLKEKMTEDEKQKFEMNKLQKDLADKEAAIRQKELNLKAIELLKENEIDINFRDFVIGNDEKSTIAKVENLKKLWQEALQSAVEGKFKDNGRQPQEPPKEPAPEPDNMPMEIYADWWRKNRKDRL